MIAILLLGPPEILHNGRPLSVARRKSRALVFYLAARRAPLPRDQALDLLWPDLPRAAAQQTLRSTLYGLRRDLGDALRADEAGIALDAGLDVDLRGLEDALAAADPAALDAALARHRGDFLAGFALEDAPAFEDWADAMRERVRRTVTQASAALARAREGRGDYPAALEALERAMAIDPLQEDVQRAAMRVQYLAGDRVGAIRRYEQLSRRLDEELGVPPMAETRAVYDAIITDTFAREAAAPAPERGGDAEGPSLRTSPASPLPFTGRAAELYAVGAITSAQQVALLEGEPGIGKTRLVEEYLRGAGVLALTGAARELDQALPYQPVVEALRGLAAAPEWPALRDRLRLAPVWMAEAARLCPDLAPPGRPTSPAAAPTDEARLREGLSQLLRAVAAQRRVALFLDDMHWADASTLGLLGYLARQRVPGLALIGATRPAPPRSPLAALLHGLTREGLLGRVRLPRLSDEETGALARHLAASGAETLAVWLARSAEGNPYVMAELVRYARAQGIIGPDGALRPEALGAGPVVPPTIYSLIESRLAPLSEPARRVLDTAVAAGREFDFDVVAHAAALSEDAALDALDELAAAGLVRPLPPEPHDGASYAFDHTLTMEVAYLDVGEARHRRLHRRVGEALEAVRRRRLDEVAGQIALHLREGGDLERAAAYALRAGRRAMALAAWSEASDFFRQALDGIPEERRGEVLVDLGQAELSAGRFAEASEAFREALLLAEAAGDRQAADAARLALGQSLLSQARYAEVIALARQVCAGGGDAAMRAELLWGTALSLEGSDLAGAAEHLRRAEALAAAPGSTAAPEHLAHAHFELGSVLAQQGELEQAIGRYREARAAAATAGPRGLPWHILAYNNLAYHLHLLGDPAAEEEARSGLRLAQDNGVIGYQPFLLSTLGEIALARGELDVAERRFGEGLALARRLGVPERVAGLTANLGLVDLRRGDRERAARRLREALAAADALGTRHLAAQVRVWLAPLLPRGEAREMLAAARATAESGGRRRLLAEIDRAERDVA